MENSIALTSPRFKLLGGILLVSGTAIGAGMITLPVTTGPAGFGPSLFGLLLTWVAMTYSALLVLERIASLGGTANLVSMARHALGRGGEAAAWITYLFLLYALMTAYLTGAGSYLGRATGVVFGTNVGSALGMIEVWVILGFVTYSGIRMAEKFNRVTAIVGIIAFTTIIAGLTPFIRYSNLVHCHLNYICVPLPLLVTAFGFHIVIPSLLKYFDRDLRSAKKCLFIGSVIPLGLYVIWQSALLGSLPLKGEGGVLWLLGQEQLLPSLTAVIGKMHWGVSWAMGTFALSAVVTSLIGVTLSLWDFLADGFALHKMKMGKIALTVLVCGPPLFFSKAFPGCFVAALSYAGVFVSLLLGLLPIASCWIERKRFPQNKGYQVVGGKLGLILGAFFFLLVIVMQFAGPTLQGTMLQNN
ncbi:MAG: tyrosine transporter [Verrucomicrobia bacterium]|nr:tyrosine transporter [Verrucomicrobiota bacterium]